MHGRHPGPVSSTQHMLQDKRTPTRSTTREMSHMIIYVITYDSLIFAIKNTLTLLLVGMGQPHTKAAQQNKYFQDEINGGKNTPQTINISQKRVIVKSRWRVHLLYQ